MCRLDNPPLLQLSQRSQQYRGGYIRHWNVGQHGQVLLNQPTLTHDRTWYKPFFGSLRQQLEANCGERSGRLLALRCLLCPGHLGRVGAAAQHRSQLIALGTCRLKPHGWVLIQGDDACLSKEAIAIAPSLASGGTNLDHQAVRIGYPIRGGLWL
ncbi:hypothetical protein D3C75_795630 [compost metagenome]